MRPTIFLLAAFAATALAGPTGQRSTCAIHCKQSETFKYETGKSYIFDYAVSTSTALLGTFDDDAKLQIKADAIIDVTSPCEYVLQLKNVQLLGSTQGAEFSEAIMKNPLRFSFQDGVIENLCSEETEPTWVLNFKRGVLSTFQNSMNNVENQEVKETDISGVCTTRYEVTSEGTTTTIHKTKDLQSCSKRPDLTTYLMSVGYSIDSPVQSLAIFDSTNECQQKIEDGILKEAECQETHKYKPFSTEEGGAVTKATSTLRLRSQADLSVMTSDFNTVSKSLVFDDETTTTSEAKVEIAEKILNDLKFASEGEIKAEVPSLFSELVSSLKTLEYPQLSSLYTKAQEPRVKKFLTDAVPLVGTASAAGVLRDMYMNGDLSESEVDFWFTSLAFLKNPDPKIFTAIAPLLEGTPSQKVMLGTSALVNNYCKMHSDCASETGVIQVIRRIEAPLGSGCRATNEEEKMKILIALKSLGNAGRWVNANAILRRCYAEEDNDMEIRVAALEAWRHTPCEYDRSNVQAAFLDETQDSEVRIAAYLALMSCPSQTVIDTVKSRLTSEGVNQVTSFVWTHITNLQESASPEKQWLHEMIGEDLLKSKFNKEALKFSRNFESSFFTNELNLGAMVESNVIFSSKSYLPRSAMLNLTLDLFGESINFFEVGGRIDGFEAYVERLFSPQGYFPEETVEGILKTMREKNSDHESTTLEGFLEKVTDEPQGSYYLKIFGNELHYHHFQGLENILKTSGVTNPLEFLMDLIRKGNVEYSKSYQLFDTHHTIPTVTGLPLAVTAKGIATLGLQMNGKFNANSMKNIDIEGHIHPSAAMEIDGAMLVDAHVTHTGLKLKSNLHSSTFLDGKIKIKSGKLVDVEFNTPKEKVEIINVQTKFFYLEDDEEILKNGKMGMGEAGCNDILTGIAVCKDATYTPKSEQSPRFPLVGPFATNIYLRKTDTQTGYVLKFENKKNEISLLIDTPESQRNHKVFVNLKKSKNSFDLDIQTPITMIQGSGEYVWKRDTKSAKMTVSVDGEQYGVDASLQKDTESNTIEPSLVITAPNDELTQLKGSFKMVDYSIDLSMDFKTPFNELSIKTNFDTDAETFLRKTTTVDYTMKNGNKQTLRNSLLMKREITDESTKYSVAYETFTSDSPDAIPGFNFNTIVRSLRHIESKAKLVIGPVTWEGEQLWSFSTESGNPEIKNVLSLKCPYHAIDYTTLLNFSMNKESIQGDVLLRTAPGKDITATLSLVKSKGTDVSGNIAVQAQDFKGAFEVSYNKIALGHHKIQVITKINEETCLLEGTFKNNSSKGKLSTSMSGICKCSHIDIKTNFDITADGNEAKLFMKTNINGQDYTAKLEGSSTSLLLDVNIIKHVVFNALVSGTDDMNKVKISAEWDKDVDPTKSLVIDGELTLKNILLNLKFLEKEFLLSSKLLANGAELEAKWSPEKRILCTFSYDLSNGVSLAASALTPFPGWEKQDATFSVSLKEYEVDSRFVATWKNSEQFSLIVKANVQPGMFTNAMTSTILVSSTIEGFERLSVSLEHSMNNAKIDTKLECTWNEKEVKGVFALLPNDNGIDGRFSMVSTFTEEVLVVLQHSIRDQSLDTLLEAKFGTETLTLSARGHLELTDVHNIALVLKLNTPFPQIAPVSININYNSKDNQLKVLVDGVIGEQKLMLTVTGSIVGGEMTTVTGNLRFITPFTYPFTAQVKHQFDMSKFTTEIEMSRFWSTYGNLKVHAEGHLASKADAGLNIVMSTPSNKASLTVNHKVTEKKMLSSVIAMLNGENVNVVVSGVVGDESNLVDLQAEITSTFLDLDDMKLKIKCHNSDHTTTSKVLLVKGEKSLTIDHIITFNDISNWENSIRINENYLLSNKQAHDGNKYTHSLEYTWNTKSVNLDLTFAKKVTSNFNEIDTEMTLTTPWTRTIKANLLFKYNAVEYSPMLTIEYSGQMYELSSTIKFEEAFYYVESLLTTPFWQPLAFKLNVDFKPRPAITLVLIRGDNKTTIDIGGHFEPKKLDGHLEIHSTYIPLPVSVEVKYDVISAEKSAHFIVNYDKKYELQGTISGNVKAAKWDLSAEVPFEMLKKLEFKGEYDFMTLPLYANIMLKLNSQKYQVNMNVNVDSITFVLNANENEGKFSGSWMFDHEKANVEVIFESPVKTFDSFSLQAMFDLDEKKVEIKMTKGSKKIIMEGKYENGTVTVSALTPFSGWENMKASFFISDSAISAFVSKNDFKIEADGTLHIKPGKGKINLITKSTHATFENLSVDLEYSLQGTIKSLEFTASYGSKQISVNGFINIADGLAPEMNLDIKTPFDIVTKLGGLVKWNFNMATKTAVVKAYRNDHEYNWELEVTVDSLLKGQAETKIETPITGWTSCKIVGNYDISSTPYQFMFTTEKEGDVKTFSGNLNLDASTVSAEFVTPIPNWEKIALKGDYTFESNHLTFNSEVSVGSENLSLSGDIHFDAKKPRLSISLKTPFSYASNIDFHLDANMGDSNKKFSASLKIDDILYALDFTGHLDNKSGNLNLAMQSPIPQYKTMEISVRFDFTGDVKMAEVEFTKEGQKQNISVTALLNNNNIVIEVHTPFEELKVMKFNGDYTVYNNEHVVEASYEKNGAMYSLKGTILLESLKASLKITTPIEFMKNLDMQGKITLLQDGFDSYIHIEKDQKIFELNNQVKLTPLKSSIIASLTTPITGYRDLMLNMNYDMHSDKKSASVLVKKESLVKKISIEGSFTPRSGLFKIETPMEGLFGAEYTLELNEINNKLDAQVKFYNDQNEWVFAAHGEYNANMILVRFQTPFEGYNTILINGNINTSSKEGKGVIEFGRYKFTLDVLYTMNNIHFKVTTPFDVIRTVSAEAKYTWSETGKDVSVTFTHNENIYGLQGDLRLSREASKILLRVTTPIEELSEATVMVKYDINNRDELITFQITQNDQTYGFKLGGFVDEKIALFSFEATTPIPEWKTAKFSIKLDLTSEDKNLEIIGEKNGNIQVINISGKLIGNLIDINLKTPFRGLQDFKMYGSMDRVKRSLDFQMMSDASHASISANFNSLVVELKTPYSAASYVRWEIVKVDEHTIKAEWKRNDNYVTIEIVKQGRKPSFKVEIKSEFQGWEFLALAGKLDRDTLQGYLRGDLNDEKISVSGSGQFYTKGEFELKIQTPFADYKSVEAKLIYNVRTKTFKLVASSSSSDFNFVLERKRTGILHHESTFPHATQATEISMTLGFDNGKVTITSPYPMLRNYYQEYHTNLGPVITADHIVKLNDIEVFKMDVKRDGPNQMLDMETHIRRGGHHTTTKLHRNGYSSLDFMFRRDDKEFIVHVKGSGNLPYQGTLDIDINNSFREVPRHLKMVVNYDVQKDHENKKVIVEITTHQGRVYKFDLHFSLHDPRPKNGEFSLTITTPERSMAPWKSISGSWNVEDPNNANIRLKIGDVEYTAKGKITLQESTLILVPSDSSSENIFAQWTFKQSGAHRDYFLKFGRESRYGMLKLKGTIADYAHVDVEGGFKAGPFMRGDFLFTSKWNKKADGTVNGGGTFEYGAYKGSHTVNFIRNAATRSATFEATGTSNIPNYKNVRVEGRYDFDHKAVLVMEVTANGRISRVDISITDLNPRNSRNTIHINIPILGSFGQMELTLSHDFREVTSKSFEAVARFADREAYIKANWKRSASFDKLEANIDIKSRFVGEVHINLNLDASNISDAHAEATYTRTTTTGETKNASLKWYRKRTTDKLESEIVLDTPLPALHHGLIHINADFTRVFTLATRAEYNDKHVTLDLDVTKKSITGKITTPFSNFELIEGSLKFNMGGKQKTVQLDYARGDRKVHLDFTLNLRPKKEGDFDLTLTTPFDFVKNLHIDGKWNKRNAAINYMRNDVAINFQGKADIKADKSSFDLSFTPPSGNPIHIAGSFDVEELLAGTGSNQKKIAAIELEFERNKLSFNVNGFRNADRFHIEIDGKTSFARIKNFHLNLDSQLNAERGNGQFEVSVNDFEFKAQLHNERKGSDGYYRKLHIESTLTPLPALIIGFGYDGESRIITVGYGEDKEITFSLKGKDNYRSGFSGYVDIPNFGYEGVKYDVEYHLEGSNEMHVEVEVELGGEGELEAKLVYNSEGLEARMSSLLTGTHSMRVRRSVSSDGFYAEAGVDDYNLKLRGGFNSDDTKRGFLIEGEVFGKVFSVDALFQSEGVQYTEGKFIIKTPFQGYENIGGLFTWAYVNNKVMSHAEVLLPFAVLPKVMAEINLDMNQKIHGYITVNVAEEEFTLKSDLTSTRTEGYQGNVELYTPFHLISYLKVNGNIKVNLGSFNTNLKVTAPFVDFETTVNFKVETNKITGDLKLLCNQISDSYNIHFSLEKLHPTAGKANLDINNNNLSVEYNFQEQDFLVTIDTLVKAIHRKVSLEAKYKALDNVEGTLNAIIGSEVHKIHGNMKMIPSRMVGAFDIESSIIGGQRKLTFDIFIPSESFEEFLVDVMYITEQSHSIHMEFKRTPNFFMNLKINTPLFPKANIDIILSHEAAAFTADTPQGSHKLIAKWNITRKMPADWTATLALASPLLPVDYTLNALIGRNTDNRSFKGELLVGTERHTIEGHAATSNHGGSFSLNVETPFKNIKKASIEGSIKFDTKVEVHLSSTFSEMVNTFDFIYDKEGRTLVSAVESPFIPTGMAKVEAKLGGDLKKHTQVKMNILNNVDSISGILNVRTPSSENIKVNVKITTPFKGYKKMNFNAEYVKNTDDTSILLETEKPLKFKVELKLGSSDNAVKTDFKINTEIKSFETIEGHLLLPLNSFEPKLSANMMLDGQYYGGYLGARTEAPYELAYKLQLSNFMDKRFHLRTDSSFLTLLQ